DRSFSRDVGEKIANPLKCQLVRESLPTESERPHRRALSLTYILSNKPPERHS
ncbi:hypothetical protein QQF64_002244, partial [Cirrhinus molitorella]